MKNFFKLIYRDIRDLMVWLLPDRSDPKVHSFAFIVHPRNINDVTEKYPFLRGLSEGMIKSILKWHWPMVVTEVRGMKNRTDGTPVHGWMIAIPLTAKQMLEDKKLAAKKVSQAVVLAEKMGAKIVGLGAFTSSVTGGGADLSQKTKLPITTGNTLTAAIAVEDIEKILKKYGEKIKTVAVIGATGSIGSAVAKKIALNKNCSVDTLILMSRTIENIVSLVAEIKNLPGKREVSFMSTTDIFKIKDADLIVVTTSAHGAILKSEYVKNGAIIYDLTQPKNTPKELLVERKDLIYVDGGLIYAPEITYRFKIGLPEGALFSCLTETMILAAEKSEKSFTGKVDINNISKISELMKAHDFRSYAEF